MFAHPKGLLGRIGAAAMLRRSEASYRWVSEILDLDSTDRFLDVGCGPGGLLRVAREAGADVVGVDSSPEMVRLVRRAGIDAHCAVAEHLPMADGSFSAACAMHTIDFWESRIAGLIELRRVMRPTGRVCIVVRSLDEQARPWNPSKHGFSDADLKALRTTLDAAGYADTRSNERTVDGEQLVALTSTAT